MTDAEMAIKQALHELELQKGNGVFNLPVLRRILEGGLVVEPERVVRRPATQSTGLLDLDDNGGH